MLIAMVALNAIKSIATVSILLTVWKINSNLNSF